MKRLFVAVDIPQDIQMLLHAMGRSLHGARAVPEDQIHVTLRFIGEVDGTTFHDIRDNLATVRASALTLKIQGVGHFPPRGKPRVIWAGLVANSLLSSLKSKTDTALSACGLPPEQRKFSPHVTIARLGNCSVQRVTSFLSGNAFLEFPAFEVEAFHLYSSRLTPKGAIHTREQSYPLGT